MTTTAENIATQQVNGPIQSFYNSAKTYLHSLPQTQFVSTIDNGLEKVAETCDNLVLSTSNAV